MRSWLRDALQSLRTLGREWWDFAEAALRHESDIDVYHSLNETGSPAVYVGGKFTHTSQVPFCLYFFRSTTHSQCESPRSIFLVSLNVKFGFKLSAAPSPHL